MHALRVAGQGAAVFVEQVADMPQAIMQMAQRGDVVVTMGAGSISAVPNRLLGINEAEATGKVPALQTKRLGES